MDFPGLETNDEYIYWRIQGAPGYHIWSEAVKSGINDQGKSIYFLIVKISLNSPGFPRKTNHKGHKGHKGCMNHNVIPSFCAFVRLCG
jgi:hypothetical protein